MKIKLKNYTTMTMTPELLGLLGVFAIVIAIAGFLLIASRKHKQTPTAN